MTFLEANDGLGYFSVTIGGKNFKGSNLGFF